MDNEDLDALAAEYVLGTLASDERTHTEALIAVDPSFVEIVRQWERRLGELNVMVEAVEPPAEIWDRIESAVQSAGAADEVHLAPIEPAALGRSSVEIEDNAEEIPATLLAPLAAGESVPERAAEIESQSPEATFGPSAEANSVPSAEAKPIPSFELRSTAPPPEAKPIPSAEAKSAPPPEAKSAASPEAKPIASAEARSAPSAEVRPNAALELKAEAKAPAAAPPRAPALPTPPGKADVLYLARRMRRWRRWAIAAGVLAAALMALIAASQIDPGLVARGGFHIPRLIAQTPAPGALAPPPGTRLVAVLQQEPSAPAFLLTLDPASKTLTVRRIAAKAEAGHSYELWLIAPPAGPRALGVVGEQEFTQTSLPGNFDFGAARTATYAISFESAGGSKSGAPSGPMLFTGKLVDSVPPLRPAPPKT